MERVKLSFVRTGEFTMIGGASVDVEDPDNWEEIEAKAQNGEFAEYLPVQIIHNNDEWDFDLLPTEEELEELESAND